MDSANLNLIVWGVIGALGSLVVVLWEDNHTSFELLVDLVMGILGGILFGVLLWEVQMTRGIDVSGIVYLPNALMALVGAVALVVGVESRRRNHQ